jgi:hypothetical protein
MVKDFAKLNRSHHRSALPPAAQAVLDVYASQMGPDAAAARY